MQKKRAWILVRVSTLKKSQDQSPENQEAQLREYLARAGWEVVGVSADRASGRKGEDERPGLAEAMRMIRTCRAEAIAVTRLDRLARNLPRLLALTGELRDLGCDLIVQDFGAGFGAVDTSTAQGRLILQLMGAFAEFQSSSYGEAALAGKAAAQAKGIHCARPLEYLPDDQGLWLEANASRIWGWRKIAKRMAELKMFQPSRLVKSTGERREERPWPPSSLMRAFARWAEKRRREGTA